MNQDQINNLKKLRDYLAGPPLPGFNMNTMSHCIWGFANKLFNNDDHRIMDKKSTLHDILGLDETNREDLIEGSYANDSRSKGFFNYTGHPSDQYVAVKNIDVILKRINARTRKT